MILYERKKKKLSSGRKRKGSI